MKIQNNKLVADPNDPSVSYDNSPNQSGVLNPQYLIIHYTAGRSLNSSRDWFKNPAAKASAHLIIGIDGSIIQMVPFNKIAWHAGISSWKGLNGMNKHSIGIELDNPGKLKKVGSKYIAWFSQDFPEDKVIEAAHKHQSSPAFWHIFSQAQLESCIKASQTIFNHYKLKDILGHEDIAPLRKEDPGPAFPMESFKTKVIGRNINAAEIYTVTKDGTYFRTGPGTDQGIIGTLDKGVKVEFIKSHINWYFVTLKDNVSLISEPEGWIHNSLLEN
ncbi:MAG: N-acetylmuramoyl-L-alanine amidase [Bacteroidota bacterium]|nr:N-acetylmuramoyl-L-alanine amidase [Bacteroidota bacterium]